MSFQRTAFLFATLTVLSLSFLGCSSSSSSATSNADSVSVYLTPATAYVTAGAVTPASVIVSVLRSAGNANPVTFTVTGAPKGVVATVTQPAGSGSFGTVFLAADSTAIAGSYPLVVTASDGTANSTVTLTAIVPLNINSPATAIIARQDSTPVIFPFTLVRAPGDVSNVTVTTTGLPTGLVATITQPTTGSTGSISLATSTVPAAAGTYSVTITATEGTYTASTIVNVTVAVVMTVANSNDITLGVNSGHLQEFMSTGFQPSSNNNTYFTTFPSTTDLAALKSVHLRLQPVIGAIPWIANSGTSSTDWNFTNLDMTVNPVLTVGDQSPYFQIAKVPSFFADSTGHFIYSTANLALLVSYAQNLVRYYNTGGFDLGGKHFQSTSSTPIKWWGILNEPNLNNLSASNYVTTYNTVVPAMLAIDPTLKFVALELSDYSGQAAAYVPQIVKAAANGGISTHMDAIATHFYGTCNQITTDSSLFSGVSAFVTDIKYFVAQLKTRSDIASTPVWVTENNVNADYGTNGISNCNGGTYVVDVRGTSQFFTAYRPYVFSQLGKAGNQSLYHFLYEGNQVYGEVNNSTNAKTLAYWTDFWLQRTFAWDGSSTGAPIYKTTTTEPTSTVDILAAHNSDNSVSLMVTNFATVASTDNNGNGAPRTIYVNLTALGTFSSATEVDLNASTSITTGPATSAFTPGSTLTLTFKGYGSSLIVLKP